jgi:hypothetical protein
MNTLCMMLFFSFDSVIVNVQEGCVIAGKIEDNEQQKSPLKKHITRGGIVYFKKRCKMSLKKEGWNGANLSVFSTIKLSNSKTVRSIKAMRYALKVAVLVNKIRYKK